MKVLLLCLWVATGLAQEPPPEVTMKGQYIWIKTPRVRDDVTATFSPVGQDRWKVSFHFNWHKKDHVYEGEAQGNLINGKLEGWVAEDAIGAIYRFKGVTKKGVFSGSHLQVQTRAGQEDLLINTGTLEMSRI